MDASPGLLGPAGEWWPCEECEHHATAVDIVEGRYKAAHEEWWYGVHPEYRAMAYLDGQFRYLGTLGWFHIDCNGYVRPMAGYSDDRKPTQSQLDVLWDLFASARDGARRDVLDGLQVFWADALLEVVEA